MKYIIFKHGTLFHPVLFSNHTTHSQVKLEGATPISAGFVSFSETLRLPKCYGNSTSLKLESRGELDEEIISRFQLNSGTSSFIDYDSI